MEITLIMLPSFISFWISLFLAIYILKRKPNDHVNQLWSIFLIFVAMLALGEFVIGIIGDDKTVAILWFKILSMLPGAFMPAVFLHFTLYYPKINKLLKNKLALIMIYLPYVILFARGIFYNVPLGDLELSVNGYYTTLSLTQAVAGNIFLIHMALYGLYIFLGIFIWINLYLQSNDEIEKNQVKFLIAGASIFLGFNFIINILLPPSLSQYFSGAIAITALIMAGLIAYAIVKHKLMGEVKLVTEEDIPTKPIDYELEPGYTYIVPESKPNIGFQLFAKTLKEGVHGIVITLQDPTIIRNKYGLKKTPIIWITNKETSELSVKRKDIASINEILKPFLEKSADSVILLIDDKAITSGIKLEDRASVLALSKTFFDTVVTANSRFIISVSPRSISSNRDKKIIKTKSALLEFNRLAALVFEEICNDILQFLIRNGYIKTENIQMHLNNLGKKDKFFKNIKCHRSKNPSIANNSKLTIANMIEVQHLSKEIMIEKIKLFMSEFEKIETAMDLNSIASRAINKYGLSKNEFQLNIGDTYIIPGSDARTSFKIFSEFTAKDFRGLCITKTNPKKLMRKYALNEDEVTVFWLTDISETKKNILPPKLEHILSAIEGFLTESDDKKIILLDGIEYLIFYSGDIFDTVLGFLRRLSDRVSQTNALILIPLDPNTLTPQRMSLLTRSGMEIYKPT